MKNKILMLSISIVITGILLSSCQSAASKKNNTEDNKVELIEKNKSELQEDIKNVKEATIATYDEFLKVSEEKISVFEKNIAELKEKIAKETKEDKAILEKQLADLEKKNTAMKTKLKAYKNDGKEGWNEFATEFNKDLDELGKAFKNFTIN